MLDMKRQGQCTAAWPLEDIDKPVDGVDGFISAAPKISVVDEDDGRGGELTGLEIGYFLGAALDGLPFSRLWFQFCGSRACCQPLDRDRGPQDPAVLVTLGGVDVGHVVRVD